MPTPRDEHEGDRALFLFFFTSSVNHRFFGIGDNFTTARRVLDAPFARRRPERQTRLFSNIPVHSPTLLHAHTQDENEHEGESKTGEICISRDRVREWVQRNAAHVGSNSRRSSEETHRVGCDGSRWQGEREEWTERLGTHLDKAGSSGIRLSSSSRIGRSCCTEQVACEALATLIDHPRPRSFSRKAPSASPSLTSSACKRSERSSVTAHVGARLQRSLRFRPTRPSLSGAAATDGCAKTHSGSTVAARRGTAQKPPKKSDGAGARQSTRRTNRVVGANAHGAERVDEGLWGGLQ